MKKLTMLIVILLLAISWTACNNKVEKVEGVVFGSTKSGEVKYATGTTVYLFSAENKISPNIYDFLSKTISSMNENGSTYLYRINEDLTGKSIFDTLQNISNLLVYKTTTNDKGQFVFHDVVSGEYYIASSIFWKYVHYDSWFGSDLRYTGQYLLMPVTVKKDMDKISLN